MKAIPALLAMAVSALATPSDPGETAVHFLEKIRTKNLNLEPGADTALSPQTSGTKRKEIARRLERMARDLGDDPLEVGAVKTDGELAAVLVRKTGGFDPGRLQVFPVALVKRGADWAAAPVPASFENTGIGYAAALRQRLATLEEWMLRERVADLEKLREQSAARMRRKIEENLSAATLRDFTAQKAAERFLSACERRKLPEILGLLGGLAANLPDDWALRLRAADAAVAATSQVSRPWRLLIAPEILRVPVNFEENDESDGNSALVSIACLDPAGNPPQSTSPKVELIHLALSKTPDGFWQIDPPAAFLAGESEQDEEPDEDLDSSLLDLFPAKLVLKHPVSPQPTAGQAQEALLAALADDRPSSWARLVRTHGGPVDARRSYARAAQIWWDSRNPAFARRAIPLAIHADGDRAAAACQFFDPRNPDHFDLRVLFLEKTPTGWLWNPAPSDETRQSIRDWTDLQTRQWQGKWQEELLAACPELNKLPDSGAPAEEESRKLIESWLQATHTGDVMAALRLTARLATPDSKTTLLRNLGYEMTGARRNETVSAIIGIHRGEIWTAVGTKTITDGKPSFPLYPVIATPVGPRILLEIDLLASGSRSRDFLNKNAMDRLSKSSPPAADELKRLFTDHQSQIGKNAQP